MDAAQALADLTEISSQIEAAVLFDESGDVAGSTLADEHAAASLARAADDLLRHADRLASGDRTVTQVEASAPEGSVFVVRDGARRVAAVTGPDPTVGLVFYDLKSCLREADAGEKPKRRRAAPRDDGEA
jgi:predicted regulator of Ras-like GTPase activity (Roadblock/LC7/MglB family)